MLKNKDSGFTIVELLVAMSIFVVLVTIATGAFIQALRSEGRILALTSVSNNVSLALEQMAREIRTGYLFNAPNHPSCGSGGAFLSFRSTADPLGTICYSLNTVNGRNSIQRGDGQDVDITASNVNVTNLSFVVSQEGMIPCNPWRVTVIATVNSFPASASVNPITIQTTASSRILPREVPRADKAGTYINDCN